MRILLATSTVCLLLSGSAQAKNNIVAGSTLTLNQCISVALDNNPIIKSYEYTADAQHAVLNQAKSAYLPQVMGFAGYATNSTAQASSSGLTPMLNLGDRKLVGISANQLIFDFGKTFASIKASKAVFNSAKKDIDNQATNIVATAKQAYHAVVLASLALKLSNQIVDQYRKNLTYAQAHFDAKIRPKYDVTKAQAELSNALLGRIQAANNVLLAKAYLNNTMNLTYTPDYSVEESTQFVKYEVNFDSVVVTAYSSKPDLLSLLSQADSLEFQSKMAKRDMLPSIKASGGYNSIGTSSPSMQSWQAGVYATADIFTGLRKWSKIKEQQDLLSSLRSQIDAMKLNIYLQAKQAHLTLLEYEQAFSTAKDQVQQATENLDIANVRYQTGLGSPVEIADATVMYSNANMSLLNSLFNYKIAQSNLEKIIGSKQ